VQQHRDSQYLDGWPPWVISPFKEKCWLQLLAPGVVSHREELIQWRWRRYTCTYSEMRILQLIVSGTLANAGRPERVKNKQTNKQTNKTTKGMSWNVNLFQFVANFRGSYKTQKFASTLDFFFKLKNNLQLARWTGYIRRDMSNHYTTKTHTHFWQLYSSHPLRILDVCCQRNFLSWYQIFLHPTYIPTPLRFDPKMDYGLFYIHLDSWFFRLYRKCPVNPVNPVNPVYLIISSRTPIFFWLKMIYRHF
jgi:hypothetical protein